MDTSAHSRAPADLTVSRARSYFRFARNGAEESMKNTFFGVSMFLAGVAAGVAFVVSCGNAATNHDGNGSHSSYVGPPRAIAQLNCSQFETMIAPGAGVDAPATLPSGWVPFGVSTSNNVYVARCAQ